MIDFRYHLVSIVSIFMALAVGIVLGAGPLKGTIGDTLTQEVTQLREDRAALRVELDAARRAGVARDEFTTETRTRLVGGTLAGATVALVVLPGADADQVEAVSDTLTAAGASIVSRTTIEDSWIPDDDEATTAQRTLATELRRSLGLPAAAASDSAPLDDVLAASLVSTGAGAVTDAGKAALDALAGANLLDADTADLQRAGNAVIVGGVIKGDVVADRDRAANRLAGLAAALDRAGQGAVLASDVGVTGFAGASSVVRAARGDAGTSRNLSTVDDLSLPLGQVSVAYALAQQNEGGVGQYGLGDGVSAGYPPVPAS
ncbi:copper transporter [Knoellia locipacati]|uniref:copper transporter n=1 Tax=Knoellia locipacati TaxID=882824 RepID=UPI00384F594A